MFQQVIGRFRREGGDLDYETRLLMPDRSIKHLHVVAHVRRNQDGEMEVIGTVHDVTQRRQSDEALDRVRSELAHMARVATLGALTASIAHEVNQPLSGIMTNASTGLKMLAADPPNVEGARETARRTIRDGQRAADVIARLRALFCKKESRYEWVDLNEAAREVIALTAAELDRSRVAVLTELADDLPLVMGDRVQLQQVIVNLLLNAVDAMRDVHDRPRRVVIRTGWEDGLGVHLAVRDEGVGIDVQTVRRLFEPFFTTKRDGMGIGLSISRSIIENHRGRLWAAPNDGPGATFTFAVPVDAERAPGPHASGESQASGVVDAAQLMRTP